MRDFLLSVLACCVCISSADAAVRNTTSPSRMTSNSAIVSRTNQTSGRTISQRTTNRNIRPRTTTTNVVQSSRTQPKSTKSDRTDKTSSAKTVSRTATNRRAQSVPNTPQSNQKKSAVRSATRPTASAARATTMDASQTNAFGSGYNTCRDAYFTCMDQFCAKQNESYRRCICSSRISEIQSREQALGQTVDSLQTFQDLNIDAISKTAAEVKSMITATRGESAIKKDTSDAANQLAGISDVLNKTKRNALSTQGTLDIAGDINSIWMTTDITSGANIANLTGEALYNAVHAQCAEFMVNYCPNESTQKMVESAYGMYIENDCSALINALDKKLVTTNSSIRATERAMQQARLENYNTHNSAQINDCVNKVRADITQNTACGSKFIHCLDFSGRYLNYDTGEPIYTADFYQLENQISLSGDILNNQTNRLVVKELNNKKSFAQTSLDSCRDISDEVWDEFVRQAIREIYQGQQERIRQVKDNCLDVVNTCYDEQSKSLKDFSNIKDQLVIGQRLELSEKMCAEKLNACSNLYGDMTLLVAAMHNITDQKIAKECRVTLIDYTKQVCAVPGTDTLHSYPYNCRMYKPGNAIYATIENGICNTILATNSYDKGDNGQESNTCSSSNCLKLSDKDLDNISDENLVELNNNYHKKYTSCNQGFFLSSKADDQTPTINSYSSAGPYCAKCPEGYFCAKGNDKPKINLNDVETITSINEKCGGDQYIGSLYQKLVRYALNTCVRPSGTETGANELPTSILADINTVMDEVRTAMAKSLADECERLGGTWVSTPPTDVQKVYSSYTNINADYDWGYCADTTPSAPSETPATGQ